MLNSGGQTSNSEAGPMFYCARCGRVPVTIPGSQCRQCQAEVFVRRG